MESILCPVARRFAQAGFALYKVGGSVRNPLLGLPASDLDLCGPATVEETMALLAGSAIQAAPRARHLGTLMLTWQAEGLRQNAEYTCFRKDSYRKGHTPTAVVFTRELSEDALRRDFSVNALYQNAATGELVDPVGGLADLRARVLRSVTADPHAMIKDDGLRLLRMIRFSGELGFSIDPALWHAALPQILGLREIVPERQWDEFEKIILCDLRYPGLPGENTRLSRALEDLRLLGAMSILLPGLSVTGEDIIFCVEADRHSQALLSGFEGHTASPWSASPFSNAQRLGLRMAALLHRCDPSEVERALLYLRVSKKKVELILCLLRLLNQSVEQESILPIVARCGPDRSVMWAALRSAGGDLSGSRQVLDALSTLRQHNAPAHPGALALSGQEVRAMLGDVPPSFMKPLRSSLWEHVLDAPHDNQPHILRRLARQWIEKERNQQA